MAKKRKTEKVAPAEPLKNGKPSDVSSLSSKQQDKVSPPASKRKKTAGKNSAPPVVEDDHGRWRG